MCRVDIERIDIDKFKKRFEDFQQIDRRDKRKYQEKRSSYYTVSEFYERKIKIEDKESHILDEEHRGRTCKILADTLIGTITVWQVYRPRKKGMEKSTIEEKLSEALKNISDAYDAIRRFNLVDFDKVPEKDLEDIFYELGCVKAKVSRVENTSEEECYIIAVCKPLMFLWGQIPVFDEKVRGRLVCTSKNKRKWSFIDWKRALKGFQEGLKQNNKLRGFFEEKSKEKYGTSEFVPYGHTL